MKESQEFVTAHSCTPNTYTVSHWKIFKLYKFCNICSKNSPTITLYIREFPYHYRITFNWYFRREQELHDCYKTSWSFPLSSSLFPLILLEQSSGLTWLGNIHYYQDYMALPATGEYVWIIESSLIHFYMRKLIPSIKGIVLFYVRWLDNAMNWFVTCVWK